MAVGCDLGFKMLSGDSSGVWWVTIDTLSSIAARLIPAIAPTGTAPEACESTRRVRVRLRPASDRAGPRYPALAAAARTRARVAASTPSALRSARETVETDSPTRVEISARFTGGKTLLGDGKRDHGGIAAANVALLI